MTTAAELRAHALQRSKEAIDRLWERIDEGDEAALALYINKVMPMMNLKDDPAPKKLKRELELDPDRPRPKRLTPVERVDILIKSYLHGSMGLATLQSLCKLYMDQAELSEVEEIKRRLEEIHQLSS